MKTKSMKEEIRKAKAEILQNINIDLNKELINMYKNELNMKKKLKSKDYSKSTYKIIRNIIGEYEEDNEVLVRQIDNIKYRQFTDILSISFSSKKHYFYVVNTVKKMANKISKDFAENELNGLMICTVRCELEYRSGYLVNIGEDVEIYNPADSGFDFVDISKIDSFILYVFVGKKALNAGGYDDKHNDCLYNAIKKFYYDITKHFPTPDSFKKYLKLKRNDKVSIELIPMIEKKFKTVKINVSGDFEYISPIKSDKEIHLTLINEHYDICKEKLRENLCKFVHFKEKKIMMYDKITYEGYNGIEKRVLSFKEKNNMCYQLHSSEYVLVDRDEKKYKTMTIEEEYDQYIKSADILKEKSNGLINLYKTGSINNTAMNLFDKLTKHINEIHVVKPIEANWINKSAIGALINYFEYEGPLYKYDVVSLYPYLMSKCKLMIPIKEGEFQTIDKFNEEFIKFGIYRAIIKESKDFKLNHLFRFNKENYYTNYSINHAKKLGLEIELIVDNQPNFLYYSRDKCICASEIFGSYVDILYDLKKQKVPLAKDILNRLWGMLCQKDVKKHYDDGKNMKIHDTEEILEMCPSIKDKNITKIKTCDKNQYYKTKYCRLLPFLISFGRAYISDMFYEYRDDIYRIQTDSMLITRKIHDKTECDMGALKYEGYCEFGTIKNCSNPIEFKED